MKGVKRGYYVEVRNRSPFGKLSVCDALSNLGDGWSNFVVVDNWRHAVRLSQKFPLKWRHVDLREVVRGKRKVVCVLHQDWKEK